MNRLAKWKNYILAISVILLVAIMGIATNVDYSHAQILDVLIDRENVKDQILFLSDIDYSKAQVGWGNIAFDKTQSNESLILRLDGYSTVFRKGIWAHATSTIEYDLREYKDYAYFTTYYGLNTTAQGTGNGVKFYIYTSVDGKEWTLRTSEDPTPLKGTSNAGYAKIDIQDANYLRLYAHDNGSNASDHAVWADSKLVKADYNDDAMMKVEDFDAIIKANYSSGPIKNNLKLILLQRNFIKRVGQYQLRDFIDNDPKNLEMLKWFLYDEDALRLWTFGGIPNGTYGRALQILSALYDAHKEDLRNESLTALGTKYKDLYLRMMLALSLTHSSSIGLWIGGNQLSDAVVRYEIFKEMHANNQLYSTRLFENLTVEEMRWLMHVNIDDEEIKWLHDYSLKRYSNLTDRFNPFKYIKYTLGYNYNRPQYYSQENYAKWDQKYNLSDYNITYQAGKPKLWIVFEEGAVCGGLSKTAANLYGSWGVPASVVGQPAHAAYIYYYEVGGKGAWQLAYNVVDSGWANTQGYSRMPNDWGNFSSGVVTNGASIKSASYFFLAQEAQNEYEKYEEAEFVMLLEDIYKTDKARLERIYRDTLEEEIINWDAWLGLVKLYITDEAKTEENIIALAKEISEVYTYQPLPMYDLTRKLATKLTSPEYKSKMMLLQNQTLRQATKATGENTIQYKEVPIVAQALLGEINSEIATFSFDGANAGKIILSKQLQSTQVTWKYSLNGGQTWKESYEHTALLTKEEIDSINIDNDIKIHISGLPLTAENIYTIDITKRTFPSGVVTINDEEDRMIGVTNEMEWSLNPYEGWNSFANTNPIFNGNKRVYVRVIAKGTQIASDPVYFTFKENNVDDTKWYIQSKNLSVVEVNATQSGNKDNILDGNVNTYWRSKEKIMPAYVTIKINEPRYISGLDYVPDKNALFLGGIPYGKAQNIKIYVSMDGTNWELAVSKNNIGNNNNLKHIDFPEPKKAQYVKFECTQVYDGPIISLTVSVIKLYENVLVNETPRAEVNYNIAKKTNQNVVAELVNETRPITVTNNDGKKTYTFTKNGEFTFEYVDKDGNVGRTTAKVDWIDKEPPQVEVSFNTTKPTNGEVVATLTFNKNVTILSKDVQIAENPTDGSKTITFLDNATYNLEFEDELGNIGTKRISVDWIDKIAPTAEFEYNTTYLTEEPVIATLKPSENVTITNNDGKNTYTFNTNGSFTFEFVDTVGNKGSATATVTWIAKLPKYEIIYSTKEQTNQNVEVKIELEDGYDIMNNDGNNTFIYEDNGEFEFEYTDNKGNTGKIYTSVNWIDKVAPTAELEYIKSSDKVTVKVVNPSEEITFKEGNGTYVYKENGEYEIIFYDKVGNEGKLIAKIDSIKVNTDDNKPDDKPSTDNKPNQDKPNIDKPNEKPDDNKPNVDNKPDNNNKPGENNSGKPNQPNDTENPGSTNPPSEENPSIEYKDYISNNIKVEIPKNALTKEGTLEIESFDIPSELKDKFGPNSEYYDIYLKDELNSKFEINSEDLIKISLPIKDLDKEIEVYEILENNEIKKLEYTKENDYIIIKSNRLGKYVLSYKEIEEDKPLEEEKEDKSANKNILEIATLIGALATIGSTVYIIRKRKVNAK